MVSHTELADFLLVATSWLLVGSFWPTDCQEAWQSKELGHNHRNRQELVSVDPISDLAAFAAKPIKHQSLKSHLGFSFGQ